MRFNPKWVDEVGPEALAQLRVFGYRQIWKPNRGSSTLVMRSADDGTDYLEDETKAEEGFATENQVSTDSHWSCRFGKLVALPFTEKFLEASFSRQKIMLILSLILNSVLGRDSMPFE